MGGACDPYGEGRGVYRIYLGRLRERDHWGDPVIDGRVMLIFILKDWDGVMDWIDLAQESGRLGLL